MIDWASTFQHSFDRLKRAFGRDLDIISVTLSPADWKGMREIRETDARVELTQLKDLAYQHGRSRIEILKDPAIEAGSFRVTLDLGPTAIRRE